jgi:hypothetical protein
MTRNLLLRGGPGAARRGARCLAQAGLQGQVRELMRQLEKQPKDFDGPLDSKLRP